MSVLHATAETLELFYNLLSDADPAMRTRLGHRRISSRSDEDPGDPDEAAILRTELGRGL